MRISGLQKPVRLLENRIDWDQHIQEYPEMKAALSILRQISEHGGEAFVIGGAVRDILMGKTPSDIDIVTDLTPEEVEKIFPHHHDIGANKTFGIAVVTFQGFDFEIATYREDVYSTLGLGADSVKAASSFKDDVLRRDFTMNGLGIDKDGTVIDFVNGEQDITNHVIRAIGDPDLRFGEDYVRMLRAIRFAARSGFDIDQHTGEAIKRNSENIRRVAPERVYKELKKMAEQDGNHFADAVLKLREYGLLQYILPEIESLAQIGRQYPRGQNVLDHVVETLRQNRIADPVINLSILFHDIGKIDSQTDENGILQHLRYAEATSRNLDMIAKRLRLDNETRDAMKFAALNHMKFLDIQNIQPQKILKLMSSPYWKVLLATAEASVRSRTEFYDSDEWDSVLDTLTRLQRRFGNETDPLSDLRKIVNGQAVMNTLGIPPGREVGEIILRVIDDIVENDLDFRDEQVVNAAIRRAENIPA